MTGTETSFFNINTFNAAAERKACNEKVIRTYGGTRQSSDFAPKLLKYIPVAEVSLQDCLIAV